MLSAEANALLEELREVDRLRREHQRQADALSERRTEIVQRLFSPHVSGGRAPVTAMREAMNGLTREAVYRIRDGKRAAAQRQRDARAARQLVT